MKSILVFILSLMLLLVWILGCSPVTVVRPNRDVSNNFNINELKETKVGEIMLSKIDGKYMNGFEVRNDFQIKDHNVKVIFGHKFRIIGTTANGDYVCLGDDESYNDQKPPYCIVVNKDTSQIYSVINCSSYYSAIRDNEDIFKGIDMKLPNPSSLDILKPYRFYVKGSNKIEVAYTGKSGKILKLQLREFLNENMRTPSNTQDLSFDLSESKTISIKNLVIDVIEATNSKIKYKVISAGE